MRLGILDQSPISTNQNAQAALAASAKLAQAGEKFGFTRYWLAEHHDLPGLACSAPEVMLSYIGAHTSTIRIGAGAVLLPYYKPYKVAEVYNMLATLFPNRVDLGIGRAPGGSAEASNALSENFLKQVWAMPENIKELLQFLDDEYPAAHEQAALSAAPVPAISPVPWLLGTSKKSAALAGSLGLSYTFGHFMSENDGPEIVQQYKLAFKKRKNGESKAEVIVAVSVICAETTEQAEAIALSSLIWSLQRAKGQGEKGVPSIEEAKNYKLTEEETEKLTSMKEKMIIGNPLEVKNKLCKVSETYGADEIMIVTITYDIADKIQSYRLIAEELLS